jgi:hypothetical protein
MQLMTVGLPCLPVLCYLIQSGGGEGVRSECALSTMSGGLAIVMLVNVQIPVQAADRQEHTPVRATSAGKLLFTTSGSDQGGDQEQLPADIRGLPIGFAAMSDPEHSDDFFALINLVDDSIVSDPNPPIVLRAGELAAPWRPRVLGQSTDARDDTMEGLL